MFYSFLLGVIYQVLFLFCLVFSRTFIESTKAFQGTFGVRKRHSGLCRNDLRTVHRVLSLSVVYYRTPNQTPFKYIPHSGERSEKKKVHKTLVQSPKTHRTELVQTLHNQQNEKNKLINYKTITKKSFSKRTR